MVVPGKEGLCFRGVRHRSGKVVSCVVSVRFAVPEKNRRTTFVEDEVAKKTHETLAGTRYTPKK